jgi:hypothetical protein
VPSSLAHDLLYKEMIMNNKHIIKKNIKRLLLLLLIIVTLYVGVHLMITGTIISIWKGSTPSQAVGCLGNMRQISFFLEQVIHEYGYIPAYIADDNNQPLHSWRVFLLPYIDEKELYQKIRLYESWDSEYNSQFHDYKIPLYQCPASMNYLEKTTTNYFFVTGIGSLFDKSGKYFVRKDQVFDMEILFANNPKAYKKKVLLVESSKEVCWMCPVDITLDEHKSNEFKPATDRHINIITHDLKIANLKGTHELTKCEIFLINTTYILAGFAVLQFFYVVILVFYKLFKKNKQEQHPDNLLS